MDYKKQNNEFERLINKRLQINDRITENSQLQSEDIDEITNQNFDIDQERSTTKTPFDQVSYSEIIPAETLNQATIKLR